MVMNVATKALQLFRRDKPEAVHVLDEDEEMIRDFILKGHIAQEYGNGLKFYEIRIEENSPIWNRLRLK